MENIMPMSDRITAPAHFSLSPICLWPDNRESASEPVLLATALLAGLTFSSDLTAHTDSSPTTHNPMLASDFHSPRVLQHYWISEKLDGVRAYWDGEQLTTRSGQPIRAPHWFTAPLPAIPVEGELWIGRQRFSELSGIIRTEIPDDDQWKEIRYMIFDLPAFPGMFDQRKLAIENQIKRINQPWISSPDYFQLETQAQLDQRLKAISAAGAEGLMLHHKRAIYHSGRSDNLMKYKLYQDAEATVIGYTAGKGQFEGLTGALKVRLNDGREMKIGSGLSIQDRKAPPVKGSIITYRHNGFTQTGLPRFARFMRIRDQHTD